MLGYERYANMSRWTPDSRALRKTALGPLFWPLFFSTLGRSYDCVFVPNSTGTTNALIREWNKLHQERFHWPPPFGWICFPTSLCYSIWPRRVHPSRCEAPMLSAASPHLLQAEVPLGGLSQGPAQGSSIKQGERLPFPQGAYLLRLKTDLQQLFDNYNCHKWVPWKSTAETCQIAELEPSVL